MNEVVSNPVEVAQTAATVVNSAPALKSAEAPSALAPAAEPDIKPVEAAADSAAKPDEAAGDEHEEPKPLPKNVQRKIDKLTRQRQEAREAVAAKDAEARLLRERLAQYEQPQPAIDPARKPRIEDYNFDPDAYESALDQWHEARGKVNRRDEVVRGRIETFAKKNPEEWTQAISAPIEYTPAMLEAIYDSELGPEIGVYLAKNLDEAEDISGMSPVAAVKAIAKIELKLQTKPDPPAVQKKVTQTPDPPSLVSGVSAISKSVDEMTTEERINFWRNGGLKQYQRR